MSAQKKLVFENNQGEIIRVFHWTGDQAYLVQRFDNKRMSVFEDTAVLDAQDVSYEKLQKITRPELDKAPVSIEGFGKLKLVDEISTTDVDIHRRAEESKTWLRILVGIVVLGLVTMGTLVNLKLEGPDMEEKAKEIAAKIIKNKPKHQRQVSLTSRFNMKKQKVEPKKRSVKRLGALAALGSLNKSKQRAGLNLGAVKTSAGPGLGGGTQGSGGVQTTLYGKGLVAAPLGVGGNIKGAGGYGTKGKGGGKAGYGKLSLIGSSGTKLIPLGRESIIEGGLDKDMISAVIQRNMGQILSLLVV